MGQSIHQSEEAQSSHDKLWRIPETPFYNVFQEYKLYIVDYHGSGLVCSG